MNMPKPIEFPIERTAQYVEFIYCAWCNLKGDDCIGLVDGLIAPLYKYFDGEITAEDLGDAKGSLKRGMLQMQVLRLEIYLIDSYLKVMWLV